MLTIKLYYFKHEEKPQTANKKSTTFRLTVLEFFSLLSASLEFELNSYMPELYTDFFQNTVHALNFPKVFADFSQSNN